ncbi:unnamed protein product, partial [Prorocentrum cordatum]
ASADGQGEEPARAPRQRSAAAAGAPRRRSRQLRLEECSAVCRSRRSFMHATAADVARLGRRLEAARQRAGGAREALETLRVLSACTCHMSCGRLLEALQRTGVGKPCARLCKHPNEEVAGFAARLVENWRGRAARAREQELARGGPERARGGGAAGDGAPAVPAVLIASSPSAAGSSPSSSSSASSSSSTSHSPPPARGGAAPPVPKGCSEGRGAAAAGGGPSAACAGAGASAGGPMTRGRLRRLRYCPTRPRQRNK